MTDFDSDIKFVSVVSIKTFYKTYTFHKPYPLQMNDAMSYQYYIEQ